VTFEREQLLRLSLATSSGFTAAFAGLAGSFSWVVAALGDRDLFFRDRQVLSVGACAPIKP
jgi:hypothetical protein